MFTTDSKCIWHRQSRFPGPQSLVRAEELKVGIAVVQYGSTYCREYQAYIRRFETLELWGRRSLTLTATYESSLVTTRQPHVCLLECYITAIFNINISPSKLGLNYLPAFAGRANPHYVLTAEGKRKVRHWNMDTSLGESEHLLGPYVASRAE
ncbi:hypothetical protein BJ508DRAFT_108663 [Ascobolus immersus RN42]|uniref:Uncharacterized protein n=1 Tax=Ascobolus immersus RN42 TaxID=1160509 RepID=A0A3N4I706_ASCIM|nr:hypothetical protein BJ508DRAFT_108663 [Ascobolus immersus RN42]